MAVAAADHALAEALQTLWSASGHDSNSFPLPHLLSASPVVAQVPGLSAAEVRRLRLLVEASPEQLNIATDIVAAMSGPGDAYIYINGRAGAGKSTLANHITAQAISRALKVLNVATTGQAALQLHMGATAHSSFGIPTYDEDHVTSSLTHLCAQARSIAETTVIQWDEWPMARKSSWECVLELLSYLKASLPHLYVPKVFVCYGDFRQIPPVLLHASRSEVIANCVRASASWRDFQVRHLQISHRAAQDRPFAAWLETVGNGTCPAPYTLNTVPGYIALQHFQTLATDQDAVTWTFPTLHDPKSCALQKILAVTNAQVDNFNSLILDTLVSLCAFREHVAFSADQVEIDSNSRLDDSMNTEFLNMQRCNGAPPHQLRLVPGALYDLMSNMNSKERLMNHTPVVLKEVHVHHVVVTTLDGRAFPLPRIIFRWTLGRGACTMIRRQYPLRPANAATFNGAQGSTLLRCTLDARRDPFAHGHLYVALGRVQQRRDLRILTSPDRVNEKGFALIRNVVWKELLLTDAPVQPRAVLKRPAAPTSPRRPVRKRTRCG